MTDISQIPQKKQKLVSSFKEFSSFIQPKIKKNIPERVFPNSVNSFNTSGSLTARKTKTVFLELKNKKTLEIQINVSEEKELTVGWLLSESLRKMKEYYDSKNSLFPNENEILFLTSKDKNCNLDHWLTFMNRSISLLKDGQILTPFLSDFSFKTNEAMEKINLNYFHFVKIIGLGGFSTVILVRRKDNGLFYAIKIIDKNIILKKQKEKVIFNEKEIWQNLKHENIVKLYCTFQNKEKLFFVTDYCPGGELFFHLQRRGKLTEEECKFVAYEILLAMDYLHLNKIIYRDLKPENVLIDIDGHIKLADFGLSKKIKKKDQLNYTFCGSLEYLAPEMMNKSGHTLSLDYYCIGVFIYELAAGFPPSLSQKKAAIFSEVLKNDIKFPSHFSQNLKNLITKLMNKNPQKRLGSVSGIKEILNNEWFFPMSKENIARNIIKPPIKPNVYNIYIDKEIQQKFINYYDFFCNENNDSPKNPLFQRFRKFSFSAFPIEYNEKEKKKELKNKFNTEGWQLVILSETKPISQNLGDTLENNFMELKFEEI